MTTRDTLHVGDVRAVLPAIPTGSIQTCVTSPPYWQLRDYAAMARQRVNDDAPLLAMVAP